MKEKNILDVIGGISHNYVEEAEGFSPKRRKPYLKVLAACAVLTVAMGAYLLIRGTLDSPENHMETNDALAPGQWVCSGELNYEREKNIGENVEFAVNLRFFDESGAEVTDPSIIAEECTRLGNAGYNVKPQQTESGIYALGVFSEDDLASFSPGGDYSMTLSPLPSDAVKIYVDDNLLEDVETNIYLREDGNLLCIIKKSSEEKK